MDDKRRQEICRKYIMYVALSTRFALITLQFVCNLLIFDHNPEVFQSPRSNENRTVFSKITATFLGGLQHWDAQYFYHIATYGYTYENTLAFFPMFPIVSRMLTIGVTVVLPLNWDSVLLIIFVFVNVYCFVKAALALFDLSSIVLNCRLAYKAAILFSLNPATIFFVAPYSESMFAYFTFTAMLNVVQIFYRTSKSSTFSSFFNVLWVSVPIALSAATRSNGILNIGFLAYFGLLYLKKSYWPHNVATLITLMKSIIVLAINICVSLSLFVAIQIYAYNQFCTNFKSDFPPQIVAYADLNQFVLPGQFAKHNQTWCFATLPLAYSYVQTHYWNVGFLQYYHWKQIPNFLLALPLIYIVLTKTFQFVKQHYNYCLTLGMTEQNPKDELTVTYDKKMFVFVSHAAFLTIFCVFFIHVQVTTRMLCSASPVLYWFCAYIFENVGSSEFELLTSWKGFLFTNDLNSEQKFIKYYFIGYVIVGTVLFSNNFPWT